MTALSLLSGPLYVMARAILESRAGVVLTDVEDTGRRRRLWTDTGDTFVLALVIVPGDDEPRWIAVERLEPASESARALWESEYRWLRQVDIPDEQDRATDADAEIEALWETLATESPGYWGY